jgi:hypothetical protein
VLRRSTGIGAPRSLSADPLAAALTTAAAQSTHPLANLCLLSVAAFIG